VLALVLSLLCRITNAQTEPPSIDTSDPAPCPLQVSETKASARVLLMIKGGLDPKNLGASVAKAMHDDLDVRSAVTLSPKLAEPYPGLDITIDTSNIKQQRFGDYVVLVDLKTNDGRWTRSSPLRVQLTYKETTIAEPRPVVIERTLPASWPFGEPSVPFLVRTTAGPAATPPSVTQAESAYCADVTCRGSLLVSPGGAAKADGMTPFAIGVDPKDPFEIGTATGTLLVQSPDIRPYTVSFTVRTRAWSGFIVLLTMVGLCVGFVLRVHLQGSLDRREAKLALQEVLRSIKTARERRTDRAFDAACLALAARVDEQIASIRLASAERLKGVPDAVRKLQAALDEAVTASTNRRATLDARRVKLSDLLAYRWILPDAVAEVVEKARVGQAAILAALDDNDLDGAELDLGASSDDLLAGLQQVTDSCQVALIAQLKNLRRQTPALPANAASRLDEQVTALEAMLPSESPPPDLDKTAAARDLLTAMHKACFVAVRIVAGVRDVVLNEAHAVAARVSVADAAGLRTRMEGLTAVPVPERLARPEADLRGIGEALLAVDREMTTLVEHRHRGGVPPPVADLLRKGEYAQAVEIPVAAAAARDEAERGAMAGEKPTAGGAVAAKGLGAVSIAAVPVIQPPEVSIAPTARPARVAAERQEDVDLQMARTFSEIARDKAIQTLASGAGMSILALAIFHGTFFGTLYDCIAVFLWGVTSDVSVNSFVDLARAKAKP
jgi:hypothetical protein